MRAESVRLPAPILVKALAVMMLLMVALVA